MEHNLELVKAVHEADFGASNIVISCNDGKTCKQSYHEVFNIAKNMEFETVRCLNDKTLMINKTTYHFKTKEDNNASLGFLEHETFYV